MLCEKQGTSREGLATSHSLLFAPLALRGMGREESIEGREGEGTAHEELFAPLDVELASPFLVFGRLEGEGMRHEERGMRREEVSARREVPSGWEGNGGMRLAGLDARRLASRLL